MNTPAGSTPDRELLHPPTGQAPPPPAGAEAGTAPLPTTPATAGDATQGSGEIPRQAKRSDLPDESPGRMVLPNHQSVFVILSDVSRSGCCVVRKGSLALQPDDKVRIEMWRHDISTKASLTATVRWVRSDHEGRTRAGLRFIDTSIKTHRLIDDYLARSFAPGT